MAVNSNSIDQWAECFSSQDETKFFNTIRLYLGEVKTPYNKQKLTSQLAGYIRKPENTKSIISLLDKTDIAILTAIHYISKATQQSISDFFSSTYSFSEIYSALCNLTDRLVIYTSKNSKDTGIETEYFHINPLIKDNIIPLLKVSNILPDAVITSYSYDDVFSISPNFLAAFISYLKIHGCSCKSDGIIKKNDMNKLSEIFPGKQKSIQYLITAFINLSLVIEGEKNLRIESSRIEKLSLLPELQQYALLCAASVSRFSRDGLKKEAQLLIDCFSAIPQSGYTRSSILHLAFLTGTYTEDGSAIAAKSRFSRMLEQARVNTAAENTQNADLLDRMIDSAISMGILQLAGTTETGEEVYVKGTMFYETPNIENTAKNQSGNSDNTNSENTSVATKVLNIESTFSITLMPGLKLQQLLPFTDFMSIKKCGVVTEFEVSRSSVSYSFDRGWSPDQLFNEMEKYTYHDLPQNLKINISEWYNSYTSAILYQGYVLKVNEKNIQLVENAPNIKKYIKEKLAEGIYLLNLPCNASADTFISESGLEFMGTVRNPQSQSDFLPFPALHSAHQISILNNKSVSQPEMELPSDEERTELLNSLYAKLNKLDFAPNKKESLSHRISARMILNEAQLETASIRTEILEADGMDYNGKIHLIETSITNNDMLELQMPKPEGNGFFMIVGKALLISKQNGEAIIRFQFEPGKQIESILISRITHVRRLRF